MDKRDYYEVLGVGRDASAGDLKSAYRKLAMAHHPDRNPGDKKAEETFKEAAEAYEVLKDDEKRAAYNRYGHQAFQGGAGGFDFTSSFADVFDDLFGDFMGGKRGGGGRGSQSRFRGGDLRYNLEIKLDEAYHGKNTKIRVPTSVVCDDCGGGGAAGGAEPTACPTCGGAGKVRTQQGFFTIERTCATCQGAGKVISNPCGTCRGNGRVHREKTLSVNIPAGVEEGTRIRLSGEGEAGVRGAPSGDLYIFLSVSSHRLFQRDGANIHCQVPITVTAAALGGAIEVPTIDGGKARVTIPTGVQTGHQFRLKGKGMSVMRSTNRGDMYIHAQVETPVNLSKKQKELLREFESIGGDKTNPQSAGFFDKVKELWDDLRE
ncbi:MAG: molecular chaperone DnaJ [Alphaproteobacteria bacterium]|jgi:molecular chaperone DnaJ